MTIHSFHLAELPRRLGAGVLVCPPSSRTVPGLEHVECISLMRLGAPVDKGPTTQQVGPLVYPLRKTYRPRPVRCTVRAARGARRLAGLGRPAPARWSPPRWVGARPTERELG